MAALLTLITTSLLIAPTAEQNPVGNWKMTIQVGHIGEALRTVILEVTENGGEYKAELTSMQNRMAEADEVMFEDDLLTVYYGSYEYELVIDGDTATGTVVSPAGTQDVTANRQQTQLFAGDTSKPYVKTWRGSVEKIDGGYEIATRRHRFTFLNAAAFEEELESFVGKGVAITGYWRVDTIEIHTIEPWERRR